MPDRNPDTGQRKSGIGARQKPVLQFGRDETEPEDDRDQGQLLPQKLSQNGWAFTGPGCQGSMGITRSMEANDIGIVD